MKSLFFVGEHTDFGSTMEAAVRSGERAAYLIDCMYMKRKPAVETFQRLLFN